MNINRNNYEEYFLLYADKELSADEKSMVEMFVQHNHDLEEEFIMLQQSVVKPDNTITFKDKSSLFKNGFINQANYEEKFLLYTDNELSLSEIEETEKFVLSNPSLQNEFTLLQQARCEPDTSIVFPDKRLLYKKEDKGKIISFRWKSIAAAVLLGIGLWTGISYLQKDKAELIGVKPAAERKTLPLKPVEHYKEKNLVTVKKDQPLQSAEPRLDKAIRKQQGVTVKSISFDIQPDLNKNLQEKNDDIAIVEPPNKTEVIKTNNLPQPDYIREPIDKTVTTMPAIQKNNSAIHASYITQAEENSENYVFYNITTEEFKKSKVGNFLKKVKRNIERKLPFKGNGLKLGNVEITRDQEN